VVIDEAFGQQLLLTFNAPSENPTHLLFNQWWAHAPADVVDAYATALRSDPDVQAFLEARHYAEPLDLDALAALPEGTVGKVYRDWIVDNGLTAQIATDYRAFHQVLAASGMLDGMPEDLQYLVLRGFQLHDFQHVLTGYDSSGQGEIALQAFCLGQLRFPYFAMWMSVATTRITFADPAAIVPTMDAISDGWQYGRRTPQLQLTRWEDHLDRPLAEVRAEHGIVLTPLAERCEARRTVAAREAQPA
jgi:ubiquinone biosynthesis protein COQ4